MSPTRHAAVVTAELSDFADEIRRLFAALVREPGAEAMAGEWSPQLDVLETEKAVEVLVDLPGVSHHSVRVALKGDALLIVGEKSGRAPRRASSFHLVERGFGRFARAIRLARPCDGSAARAHLGDGLLRVTIPKMAERRGRAIPIDVQQ